MTYNNNLRQMLIDCEALKFGDFTLTSGKKSNYYVNMKLASTNPEILKLISSEFASQPNRVVKSNVLSSWCGLSLVG